MAQWATDNLTKNYKTRLNPKEYGKYLERILKECLSLEDFGDQDDKEVREFFKYEGEAHECSYCGESTGNPVWDYIVPAIQSGNVQLGNMVIACRTCNASKGKKSYQAWLKSKTPKSLKGRGLEERIGKTRRNLIGYMKKYCYFREAKLADKAYRAHEDHLEKDRKDGRPSSCNKHGCEALVNHKLQNIPVSTERAEIRRRYKKLRGDIPKLIDELEVLRDRYQEVMNRRTCTRTSTPQTTAPALCHPPDGL